jgi:dihydroflavonol-4-reductase
MLKVLITGASGFVGQHLLEDIDHSRFEVAIITRDPSKKMRVQPTGIKVLKADLNDLESLTEAFRGTDVLINTAAEVRKQEKLATTNVEGTKHLIKAIVENKIRKVIHLSSVGVVGMQYSSEPVSVDEDSKCKPRNEYERTKLESEDLLIEASKRFKFNLIILRPTNVFGEYHPFNALLNLMQHINDGKPILQTSKAKVNYVYVKDLSATILFFINGESKNKTFNVGEAMALNKFNKLIAALLHKKENTVTVPQFLANFSIMLGWKKLSSVSNSIDYNDSALKIVFKYPYGVKSGLERTVQHYKEKGMIK